MFTTTMLTASDIARVLKISRALAYRLMAKGDIPTIRFSRKTTRVREEDLLRWIETHTNNKQATFPAKNGGAYE